jgi:hypothetical protein
MMTWLRIEGFRAPGSWVSGLECRERGGRRWMKGWESEGKIEFKIRYKRQHPKH